MSQKAKFEQFMKSCLKGSEPIDLKPKFTKLKKEEINKIIEADALENGSILEAIIEKGSGSSSPQSGNLIFFHYTLHPEDNEDLIITSTRTSNAPFVAILEKAPRLPRGLELSLLEMTKGERRIIKLEPDFAYDHPDCDLTLPDEYEDYRKLPLTFDVTLVNWYNGYMVKLTKGPEWVLKRNLKEGEGYENPRPPYQVEANVKVRQVASDGKAMSGELLNDKNEEINFKTSMGQNTLPEGIEKALSSMVTNERSLFYMSTCAFKNEGSYFKNVKIPEDDINQIEIEINLFNVIQVRDMFGDQKLLKHRIVQGKGEFPMDCPMEDCQVKIHYKVKKQNNGKDWMYNSKNESNEPLEIELGFGMLPRGMETCIHLMLINEICEIKCHSEYGYDEDEGPEPPEGIDKEDDLVFEVELIDFVKLMQSTDLTAREALNCGRKIKEMGNQLFKKQKYKLAIKKYQKVVQNLEIFRNYEKEEEYNEGEMLKNVCHSNMASCYIHVEEYANAVESCNKALKIDEHAKLYLRRGKAFSLKGDFDKADADFDKALELDVEMKDEISKEKNLNKRRERNAIKKQKNEFKNFFN